MQLAWCEVRRAVEQPGQRLETTLLSLTDLMDLWLIEWALTAKDLVAFHYIRVSSVASFSSSCSLTCLLFHGGFCCVPRDQGLENLHRACSRPIAGSWIDPATGSQPWLHIGIMGYGKLRKDTNTWASLQRFWLQQVLSFKFPSYIRWYQGIILLIVLGVIKALWLCKKIAIFFRDGYWSMEGWNEITSGICFTILQQEKIGDKWRN